MPDDYFCVLLIRYFVYTVIQIVDVGGLRSGVIRTNWKSFSFLAIAYRQSLWRAASDFGKRRQLGRILLLEKLGVVGRHWIDSHIRVFHTANQILDVFILRYVHHVPVSSKMTSLRGIIFNHPISVNKVGQVILLLHVPKEILSTDIVIFICYTLRWCIELAVTTFYFLLPANVKIVRIAVL